MNHVLYDKIKNALKSGKQITVNYTPHHKGCECILDTNIEDDSIINYLDNSLGSWWYDDLIDNYLIPNDIYGGGEFRFILNNEKINVEAVIHMSEDSYDDLNLFDYFGNDMKDFLNTSFEGKNIDKDYVLFTFDNDGEKLENLEIAYLGDDGEGYDLIEFDDQAYMVFELKINLIVKSLRYYSKDIEGGSIWVSCNENRMSITEDWPFHFELKREE